VGPQGERYRSVDGPSPDHSLDLCSSCGICTQVCPQGVKIAEINSQARVKMKEEHGMPLRDRLISRPTVAGRLGAPVAPIANMSLRIRPLRVLLEKTLGIHRDAPMPEWRGGRFNGWARRRGHRRRPDPTRTNRTVVYFHGCGVDYYEHEVARATVAVLEHQGLEVIVPRQGCCGLPLQSNGLFDDARTYVRRLTGNLAPYARAGYDIVSSTTSCALMLKREAREILGVEDDELRLVGERVFDVMEYLAMLHERGELKTDDLQPLDMEVPYHAPCQQRGHGIGQPAMRLMRLIPQLRPHQIDASCCGVAGTYGLKREKYEIAMAVGEPVFRGVRESSAELSACDSETCRWWISEATGRPSVHPVELLRRSYRIPLE
jgi:glycerol-3-phosphate dehydrogenase subunit C